jgi:hypothetical protein|eukprot:SAG25_NODE_157_length_13480_cov_7.481653_8_plen_40_part_00
MSQSSHCPCLRHCVVIAQWIQGAKRLGVPYTCLPAGAVS